MSRNYWMLFVNHPTPLPLNFLPKYCPCTSRKGINSCWTQTRTRYPVVFHEWFLATWPEPSAWLSSRLEYGRTSAVMAIVGSILGCVPNTPPTSSKHYAHCTNTSLGDRHGENILLDSISGAIMHVDFNCLFDKVRTVRIRVLIELYLLLCREEASTSPNSFLSD